MKQLLLCAITALWVGAAAVGVREKGNMRQRRREQQLPPANATTIVSNVTAPRIIGLRWFNTDTNQPIAIGTDFGLSSIWVPLPGNPGPPFLIPDYEIAALGTTGLSIEAVTEGPVQSVAFERLDLPNTTIRNVENNAIWAMCGNVVLDFFSCSTFWGTFSTLRVTAYTLKSGAGSPAGILTTSISTVKTTPILKIYHHTPTNPWHSDNPFKLSDGNAGNMAMYGKPLGHFVPHRKSRCTDGTQPHVIQSLLETGEFINTHPETAVTYVANQKNPKPHSAASNGQSVDPKRSN